MLDSCCLAVFLLPAAITGLALTVQRSTSDCTLLYSPVHSGHVKPDNHTDGD